MTRREHKEAFDAYEIEKTADNTIDGSQGVRPQSEFYMPQDLEYSPRSLARTNMIAMSMQQRNNKMRSHAKL